MGLDDASVDQAFVPPLPFPLPPERYYFLFRQPIVTSPDDAHDRAKCNDIYLCGPDCLQVSTCSCTLSRTCLLNHQERYEMCLSCLEV